MPSLPQIALGVAQVAFFFLKPASAGHHQICGHEYPLSCHNTTAVANTCCFNAPGGDLLQTQFWDTNPATGPADSWTIHGLWPDHCDGTYDSYCDPSRQYTNITAILQSYKKEELLEYMSKYWKDNAGNDEGFWEHEWNKHGTCISTLYPKCYDGYTPQEEVVAFFQKTVDLFKSLNSYEFLQKEGIVPSVNKTYTAKEIQEALGDPRRGVNATIGCSNGAFEQIFYTFNVQGSVQGGEYVPVQPPGESILNSCLQIWHY